MENDDPTLFDLDALEDDEIDKTYRREQLQWLADRGGGLDRAPHRIRPLLLFRRILGSIDVIGENLLRAYGIPAIKRVNHRLARWCVL